MRDRCGCCGRHERWRTWWTRLRRSIQATPAWVIDDDDDEWSR